MRDTRPNNKRTLQSGQGLYWHTPDRSPAPATAKQLDTARGPPRPPRPPRLPASARVSPLLVFLWGRGSSRKVRLSPRRWPASRPRPPRFSSRLPPISEGQLQIPAVPVSLPPPVPFAPFLGGFGRPAISRGREQRRACGRGGPQSKLLRPEGGGGAVPGARLSGNTVLLLLSTWGRLSPGRAGRARRPGRGCGTQRCPVPPPREAAGARVGGGAAEGAYARSDRRERSKQTNQLTNERVFKTFHPLLFGRCGKPLCGEASDFRGNSPSVGAVNISTDAWLVRNQLGSSAVSAAAAAAAAGY